MTRGAVVFMVLSWSAVLGLMLWSFGRILGHSGRSRSEDADGSSADRGPGERHG